MSWLVSRVNLLHAQQGGYTCRKERLWQQPIDFTFLEASLWSLECESLPRFEMGSEGVPPGSGIHRHATHMSQSIPYLSSRTEKHRKIYLGGLHIWSISERRARLYCSALRSLEVPFIHYCRLSPIGRLRCNQPHAARMVPQQYGGMADGGDGN